MTGAQVIVTPDGQLGVLASSERYKTDVMPIAGNTDRLAALRPVSFHLKSEPGGAVQYGLIAEEVDKVYPELVIRDAEGRIQGVRYDELAPLLLDQMQKEHARMTGKIDAQAAEIAALKQKVDEVDDLKRQLAAVIRELQTHDAQVAKR